MPRYRVHLDLPETGHYEQNYELHVAMCRIADDANSVLPDYRVSMEHHDQDDFLVFETREPEED